MISPFTAIALLGVGLAFVGFVIARAGCRLTEWAARAEARIVAS